MTRCRVCLTQSWERVLSLGATPLANNYIRLNDLKKEEIYYPLTVLFCTRCGLVCLDTVVDAAILYDFYYYLSSESKTMLRHNAWLAKSFVERFGLTGNDLLVEIGSNTGTQLGFFREKGIRSLGVEPAENIASLANEAGITTLNRYFNEATAAEIRERHGRAKVILGRHVFAHIDDLDDVLRGVHILLEDDGALAIEIPYLVDMVDGNQFDTIYHEHLSYFSVRTLQHLFERNEMEIFGVDHLDIHGGCILVYVKRKGCTAFPVRGVDELTAMESAKGVQTVKYLEDFARRTAEIKVELTGIINRLKKTGKVLAGYGAPAKGNTLLNYCGIDATYLDYVSDNTPTKQGLYLPGTRIRIRSEEYARQHPPDYFLLLAWNYAQEILQKERAYLEAGGKFVIPIPFPRIVGAEAVPAGGGASEAPR